MNILAHRGIWEDLNDRNSISSLCLAIENGFGIETDVRDHEGKLVISHDMPIDECLLLDDFLSEYNKITNLQSKKPFLAINIKSDGLSKQLNHTLELNKIENYFVFDMSLPDTLPYLDNGMKVFLRQSEYEVLPANIKSHDGVWIDQFKSQWFENEVLLNHLNKGKKVCIVSPELHSRDYMNHWKALRGDKQLKNDDSMRDLLMICTDHPFEARDYFNEQ